MANTVPRSGFKRMRWALPLIIIYITVAIKIIIACSAHICKWTTVMVRKEMLQTYVDICSKKIAPYVSTKMEKTLESPLDCKENKPVNPKGNQPWIFTGRTDAKAETAIFWPPDVKRWLTGKDPDAGKDGGQEEKEVTEDGMVRQHHWLKAHEFEQTLGESEGRESLKCCSPWSHKELDKTEQLNNNRRWTFV